MATWIIGLIIVGCVYLASKQVIKAHKPVAALAVMPAVVRLAARIASIRQL